MNILTIIAFILSVINTLFLLQLRKTGLRLFAELSVILKNIADRFKLLDAKAEKEKDNKYKG